MFKGSIPELNILWIYSCIKSVLSCVCACPSSRAWERPPAVALWSWLFGLASWFDSSEHIINLGQLNRCQNIGPSLMM